MFILAAARSHFLHTDNQWSGFFQYLQMVPTAVHLVWFTCFPQRVEVLVSFALVFCLGSIRFLLSRLSIPDLFLFTPSLETGISSDPRSNFNSVCDNSYCRPISRVLERARPWLSSRSCTFFCYMGYSCYDCIYQNIIAVHIFTVH